MSTPPIRIGIVGAGQNTRARHIPGLQAIEGVQLVSVCNRRRESTERVAAEFQIPKQSSDWRELVVDPDIDAVVIGTWPYLHCPVTLAALAADKHVLCEARIAMNAEEARAMRDAALAKPQLVTQVVPAPMTLSVDRTASRLISEGALGNVLAVRLQAGAAFLDRQAPLHWRQDIKLSGLNIMTLGIWYECLMRWIGAARRVFARGQILQRQRTDDEGQQHSVQIPEHLDVIAEMDCGAQACFQISAVTGHNQHEGIWLFGDEGTLRFSEGQLYFGGRGEQALRVLSIPADEDVGWRVEEEFVAAIRGQEKVQRTTFEDGVRYMQFTEAVHQSMRTGCLTEVE